MNWLFDPLITLLCLGLMLYIIIGIVSPFESLEWWAGWSDNSLDPQTKDYPTKKIKPSKADAFIGYLTGIGGFSGDYLADRESQFIEDLQIALPNTVILRDIFPFSVSNNPLNGERILSKLWEWVHHQRLGNPANVFAVLIVLRNGFQVAVSADPRYGPINNVGVAREFARGFIEKGYVVGSGVPIFLIGYSGGGQISVGIASYLSKALGNAPIYILGVGGVFTDDPGIKAVQHLYQTRSTKDFFPTIGDLLYYKRWSIFPYTEWNKAKKQGKITVFIPGPMQHAGEEDYFSKKAKLPNGDTHSEDLLKRFTEIINRHVAEYHAQKS